MIRKVCCSTGMFLLLLALAGCAKPPKLEDRLKTFEGQWNVVQLNRAGKISDDEALQNMFVLVIKDGFQFFESKGKGQVKELFLEDYLIQINPANTTGEVNFSYRTGDNAGQTRQAIFAVEDNKLKICMAATGAPRPTEFVAKEEPPTTLMVLQHK